MDPLRNHRPLALALALGCAGAFAGASVAGGDPPARKPAPGAEPRVELLRAEGIRRYQAREYAQALRAFEEALAAARGSEAGDLKELVARTRSALGLELLSAGELRQAGTFFREALRESSDAYAHFGLGFINFLKLEDAVALEHLEAAARLDAASTATQKLLGLIDYRRGRTAEALSRMDRALALDPKDREAAALKERWTLELSAVSGFREFRRGVAILRAEPAFAEARAGEVFDRLDRARREIGEALQAELGEALVVVLFAPDTFHRATKSYHWVGGLYDGQVKLVYPAGDPPAPGELQALDEAIRHEIAHVFVRRLCSECPVWLNEGIAQHFERPGRGAEVASMLRERARARIRFEDVPGRLWEVDDEAFARQTYLQGLGFVEFLVERFLEFRLGLLLRAIHEEGSLKKGFETVYGLSLESAEVEWWAWVRESGARSPGASEGASKPPRGGT